LRKTDDEFWKPEFKGVDFLAFCSCYFSRFFSDILKMQIKEENGRLPVTDVPFDASGEEHASYFLFVASFQFYFASSASG
jgi:hypothetical protein